MSREDDRYTEYVVREGEQFLLESSAFTHGSFIPTKYTCYGDDVSPPLFWINPPEGTKSLVLIMYDPDAPLATFVHWILYNIPATLKSLPENIPKKGVVLGIGVQGRNDFNSIGYRGPCPPKGHPPHRYFFALHALSVETIDPQPGATADYLLKAMKGRVLGYAILMGLYEKV